MMTTCKNVGGAVAVDACEQEYAGMDRQTGIFGKRIRFQLLFIHLWAFILVKWIDRKPGISFEEKREQLLNYLEKNGNCTWKELSAGQRGRTGSSGCGNCRMVCLRLICRKNINRVMEAWNEE